jgi:dihydrofolate reductase
MIAIAAVDENWGLGKDGQLLFHLHADLRRFRALTDGHTVVLGRKTLSTFPGGKPLPNRRNIVLTSDVNFAVEGAEIAHSKAEALALLSGDKDAFIIGGESVYRQFLPECDRIFLTVIHQKCAADCYFLAINTHPEWILTHTQQETEDGVTFEFREYSRR